MTHAELVDALDALGFQYEDYTPTEMVLCLSTDWGHSDQDDDARDAYAAASALIATYLKESK